MRLPGANYGRGQSSLGREGDGAAASYEVASRTNLETQNSKNAVFREFNKLGEAYLGWEQATQEANASKALSEYTVAMSQAETVISNTRAFKTDEIDPSIQVKRYEKGPDGTDVPVDMTPAWQVAPQLYDHYAKQARERALSQVSGPTRSALEQKLNEYNAAGSNRMMEGYFKGRMEDLRSTTTAAVTNFVNAEDVAGAVGTIETAVKNGVYNVNEAREEIQKVKSGVEAVQVDRFIGSATDPAALQSFAANIGAVGPNAQFPNLTPAQRVNAMQAADARALTIQTKYLAQYDRNKKDTAAQLSNDAQLRFVSSGQTPTPEEYNLARQTMTPSEFRAFISIGRGANGQAASNPQTLAAFDSAIVSLADTPLVIEGGVQANMDDKVRLMRDKLGDKFAAGEMSLPDYNARIKLLEAQEAQLYESDQFKAASKGIQGVINPSKDVFGRSMNDVAAGVENMALLDLRTAVANDPKLDPVRWAEENLPKYRKVLSNKQVSALTTVGLTGMAVIGNDGVLDVETTLGVLAEKYKAGTIGPEAYAAGVDALTPKLQNDNPLARPKQ